MQSRLSFGHRLKRLRADLGLTQENLADRAACSVETIQAVETGRRRPSRELAERLAGVLQIDQEQRPAFLLLARGNTPATSVGGDPDRQPVVGSPLVARRTSPARWPTPLTTLIGRSAEEADVLRRVADPACRLLTLVGAGGTGKTRLALQVAAGLLNDGAGRQCFSDGVAFVELARITAAEHVAAAIIEVLGAGLTPTLTPEESLLAFLHDRKMLLVLDNLEHLLPALDNLEHLLPATELLRTILREAPEVRLLVTSRERLRLQGEWVFELGGLGTPRDDSLAEIECSDAVRLFVDRARQVAGDFVLTPANQTTVANICRLLEGMPLAIELAASWVRALSLPRSPPKCHVASTFWRRASATAIRAISRCAR